MVYVFPPTSLILKTLLKIRQEDVMAIVIAPFWPTCPWFPLLKQLLKVPPVALPKVRDLLLQGGMLHSNVARLNLTLGYCKAQAFPDGHNRGVQKALLRSRKISSNSTYYRVWKKFFEVTAVNQFNPESPSRNDVLEFLQSALDKGLTIQ